MSSVRPRLMLMSSLRPRLRDEVIRRPLSTLIHLIMRLLFLRHSSSSDPPAPNVGQDNHSVIVSCVLSRLRRPFKWDGPLTC